MAKLGEDRREDLARDIRIRKHTLRVQQAAGEFLWDACGRHVGSSTCVFHTFSV